MGAGNTARYRPIFKIFGDRLMAGQRTLTPLIVVRLHVPEFFHFWFLMNPTNWR